MYPRAKLLAQILGERLELLTRSDDNIVTLKPHRKAAAMLSA